MLWTGSSAKGQDIYEHNLQQIKCASMTALWQLSLLVYAANQLSGHSVQRVRMTTGC